MASSAVPAPLSNAAVASSSERSSMGVMAFASILAQQPCPLSRSSAPAPWAMLTAVSANACKRPQGSHIMLHNSDHVLGRTVKEVSCQFNSPNVSGRHCTISRRYLGEDGRILSTNNITNAATDRLVGCIRDSSSNGTFVNFQRLQRNGEEVQLRHGDVISLVSTPEDVTAFAFVFREVSDSTIGPVPLPSIPPSEADGPSNKRKGSPPDDGVTIGGDGKRIKGLGSGGVSGPIMLNDVRQLQRSNEELRLQVEAYMLEVEKMRSEYRSAETRHASELKDLQTTLAEKFNAQLEELKISLATKELDLETSSAVRLQQESCIELLEQRLASEAKSRVDAEEVIDGLKMRMEELQRCLEDERFKISKERADAEASLRASLDRIRMEAAEELKRHEEAAARQLEQQNNIIVALQEGEKEYRMAAEISRKKLDSERGAVVAAEDRARRLESQLQEEKALSLSAHNRAAEIEDKLRQTNRELENEKTAKEGALAKIARLEVEMEAASRDLKLEKQRLQGARERIVLRETQLRAFHSTAAEIAELQQRQQDQLSTMIRTLEDGDSDNDYDHTNVPNVRIRSPYAKAHPGPVHYSEHQSSKRMEELRGTSPNTSGDRPMQIFRGGEIGTKRILVHVDESSEETDTYDDTDGDTQQADCSKASQSAIRSSDVYIPPTQVLNVGNVSAPTCVQTGHSQHMLEGELLQITSGEVGDTRLENGEVGSIQTANADFGCTQLLHQETKLEGPSPRARSGGVGANEDRSTSQDGAPTLHRDEGEPIIEETARPDHAGLRTGYLLDNTERWEDSADDRRISLATLRAGSTCKEDARDVRRCRRDSLCTADLIASEVAGSWAITTPASDHGESDSSSAERDCAKEECRRISDDGAEYAASQVATNSIAGDKHPEGNAAFKGGKILNEGDFNMDVDMDMSQTAPKHAGAELRRLREHEVVNETLNIATLGFDNSYVHGRDTVMGNDDSSDTCSTEDTSREEGEIGASQLRESEPVSPLMYVP
uniref:FHA domain-containing protein n=1 Tax=Physcomitrium patens TaxID=3218 RepID=A0A7I4DTR9_PHYPA